MKKNFFVLIIIYITTSYTSCIYNTDIKHIFKRVHLYYDFPIQRAYNCETLFADPSYATPSVTYLGFKVDNKDFSTIVKNWSLKESELEVNIYLKELEQLFITNLKPYRSINAQIDPNLSKIPTWWETSIKKLNKKYMTSFTYKIYNKTYTGTLIVFSDGENIFCIVDEFM